MPIGLLMLGLLLLVSAMRGTTTALGKQLKLDLLGDGQQSGFIVWVVILAILAVVGTLGASYGRKDIRALSQLFMVVVLVALVLRTPNMFQMFTSQITTGKTVSPAVDENITVKSSASKGDMLEGVAGDNKGNEEAQKVLGVKTSDIATYGTYALMLI
jgi:hypothetical protein